MVKIRAAKFFNCQSWADSVLEFGPGLNVIRARNNTGKSVVFKMLKITCNPKYYSREEREKLIRYNAQYAEVSFIFDDNSACMTRVFPNTVIYFYTPDLDSIPLNQKVGEPHEEIIDRLGVVLERESGFMANIIDLEQDLLLVNSESKANLNLVKILTEHEQLNRLVEQLFEKLTSLKVGLDRVTVKREQCKYRLEGYKYTDTSNMKSRLAGLELMTPVIKSLKTLNSCVNSCSRTLKNTDNLKFCNKLISFSLELSAIDKIKLEPCKFTRDDLKLINLSLELIPSMEKMLDIKIPTTNVSALKAIKVVSELCELVIAQNDLMVERNKLIKSKELIDIGLLVNDLGLVDISNKISSLNGLYLDINNKKKLLDTLGEKVECPIHGSITYIDGQCIPVF